MAEIKTSRNDASVIEFLHQSATGQRLQDCLEVLNLMQEVTGEAPAMWGTSIVGFGKYRLKYASGRELDWMYTGFSPRKQNLTVYLMDGFERQAELMAKLGKYKTGKSCLYLNKLEDIDREILNELVMNSVDHIKRTHD